MRHDREEKGFEDRRGHCPRFEGDHNEHEGFERGPRCHENFQRGPRGHEGFERRRPEGFEPHFDRDDLDGLFMACARMMRFERHGRFGFSQDRIVKILAENGGSLAQKTLQMLLGVQPGSMSEILSKMEDKGLIIRDKDEEDRRACLIRLNTEAIEEEKKDYFFDVLSEEEKQSLKEMLNKVLEAHKPEFKDNAQE